MDFRKVIAFGKSSFVISLPKDWLQNNNLSKGDVVFLEHEADKLVLVPKEKETVKEEKRTLIKIDGKDINRIRREISSAFINYNDHIIIEGKDLHKYAEKITKLIHNLIAVEIIEQSSNKIVARDFLKVGDISIKSYLHKADIIIRSMISDIINPSFTHYNDIINRQAGIKRIYLLILKTLKAVFNDHTLIKKLDIEISELPSYYRFNFSLQRIGACLRIIAKSLQEIPKSEVKKVQTLLKEMEDNYLTLMKIIHNNDVDKAYNFSNVRDKQIEKINDVLIPNSKQMFMINERIAWIYFELHEMNHRIYS